MPSKAATVEQYLAELPADRRSAIEVIRRVILENLPKGYEEGMQYGMIGYYVPHRVYPPGYHCDPKQPVPFASIASQKNHIGIYLMCIYGDERHREWFTKAWTATGCKLDMGKGCVRVKKLEDVPLEVLGEAIARVPVTAFIANYESMVPASPQRGKKTIAKSNARSSAKPARGGKKKSPSRKK